MLFSIGNEIQQGYIEKTDLICADDLRYIKVNKMLPQFYDLSAILDLIEIHNHDKYNLYIKELKDNIVMIGSKSTLEFWDAEDIQFIPLSINLYKTPKCNLWIHSDSDVEMGVYRGRVCCIRFTVSK